MHWNFFLTKWFTCFLSKNLILVKITIILVKKCSARVKRSWNFLNIYLHIDWKEELKRLLRRKPVLYFIILLDSGLLYNYFRQFKWKNKHRKFFLSLVIISIYIFVKIFRFFFFNAIVGFNHARHFVLLKIWNYYFNF